MLENENREWKNEGKLKGSVYHHSPNSEELRNRRRTRYATAGGKWYVDVLPTEMISVGALEVVVLGWERGGKFRKIEFNVVRIFEGGVF